MVKPQVIKECPCINFKDKYIHVIKASEAYLEKHPYIFFFTILIAAPIASVAALFISLYIILLPIIYLMGI